MLGWLKRLRTPRPAYTEVPSGTPGLTRLVPGPRAAREADARARVRRGLRLEPNHCFPCHYGFLLGHARAMGTYGEWSLCAQEYEAALDELRVMEAQACICPVPGRARQDADRVNAPWA